MATLTTTASWGLGLGRLSVQSSLGETLRAEIDVSSLSAEEAGSLKVRIAPADIYRTSGVEFNAILSNTQVQLARRADGRPYFRIQSDRAVQEPFVDVILEITWTGGRLVREYTLLFDPPATPSRQAAPPAVATSPVIAPAPAEPTPLPSAAPAPAPAPSVAAAPQRPASPAPAPRARPEPVSPPPAAPVPKQDASQYQVKPGDSLSRVAAKTQAPGVSLDQMLVGLFRSNPEAFIEGNMNRLKSGSVLQVPASDELTSVSPGEARQIIVAQSADFESYRQRLAGAAPVMKQDESPRQAKGQVQTAVEDRKPAPAATPDKLTLSKAGVAASEAKVSKDTEKKDSAARVAELTRNVEELKKLSSAAKPAVATPPAPPAAPPAVAPPPSSPAVAAKLAAPPPSAPVAVAPPPSSPAMAASTSSAPVAASTKPASLPVAASRPKTITSAEAPGLLDGLLDSPFMLPGAAALIALLGGFGLYRLRARNAGKNSKPDTGFHESRLQPDSFFGSAGGQRVDTRDQSTTGQSSMSYSLSQLDAIGDVDPVAEADVYLAYGRDLQAEEILKEALRANPERMAIRLKLLEVYAKRRDIKGFEQLAVHLYAETQGQGEDWDKAQELGRQIDPDNPLYQPGGAPAQLLSSSMGGRPEPMDASTLPQTVNAAGMSTEPMMERGGDPAGPVSGLGDLDLDLDLDLGGGDAPATASMEATQAMAISVEQAPMEMDFDLSKPPPKPAEAAAPEGELEFDLDQLDTAQPAASEQAPSLDFDLSSIDLDLPAAPATATSASEEMALPDLGDAGSLGEDEGDPLQRQLELADEFRQIGDTEGARDVLQELVSKASGVLKAKAQAMLDELR